MDRQYRLVSETHRPAPKTLGTDTTEYTYDALGNLTRVELPNGTVIGYLLDAMNRRIGKTVNDTLVKAWLYQGQLTPVAELDGSGNVVSRFVYATGVNVPDYLVRGDSTYRIIRDHLGSVRLVVNVASGTVAQRVSYDEFGIETENTNPGWQPFGYAGGLTDSQTGLVRFGARDYDPVAGRWTAKDPIGFAGGAFSHYEYAANEPLNYYDLDGRARIGIRPLGDARAYFFLVRPLYHSQIFYDNGEDSGFFPRGVDFDNLGKWREGDFRFYGIPDRLGGGQYFDDALMREAESNVQDRFRDRDYNLLAKNCQDYVEAVVEEYMRLTVPGYRRRRSSSIEATHERLRRTPAPADALAAWSRP